MLHITSIAAFILNLLLCVILSLQVFFAIGKQSVRFVIQFTAFVLQAVTLVLLLPRLELVVWGDYFLLISFFTNFLLLFLINREQNNLLSLVTLTLSLLLYGSSSLLMHWQHVSQVPKIAVVLFHIIPACISLCSFLAIFIFAALYLVKNVSLKRKQFFAFLTLPALGRLEKNLRMGITIAYLMTSISVVSGLLFCIFSNYSFLLYDSTSQFSIFTWLMLAVLSYINRYQILSAKKLAKVALLLASLYILGILLILLFVGNQVHV